MADQAGVLRGFLGGLRRRIPRNNKVRVGLVILAVFIVVAIIGPPLASGVLGISPEQVDGVPRMAPPSADHWLGTTAGSEDVLAQMLLGTRTSLLTGLVAGAIATVLAVAIGLSGAYLGGKFDAVITMFTNVFLVMPAIPLLVITASYLRGRGGWLAVALIIGLTGWAGGARIKRAQALSLRRRDFMTAAELSGERTGRIVFAEMMPHLAPLISTTFLFSVVGAILAESGLAFIGVGNINEVTWGSVLYWAQSSGALVSGAWWFFVPPGLCIALVGTAAGLVNFGMDEVSDPRLRSVAQAKDAERARKKAARKAARKPTAASRTGADA
jgi:peptide/nickel transport system permease protein